MRTAGGGIQIKIYAIGTGRSGGVKEMLIHTKNQHQSCVCCAGSLGIRIVWDGIIWKIFQSGDALIVCAHNAQVKLKKSH